MKPAYKHDSLARYQFGGVLKDHGCSRLAWGQIDGAFEEVYLANSSLPQDHLDPQVHLSGAIVGLRWQTTEGAK
jgi:hypothetical protein